MNNQIIATYAGCPLCGCKNLVRKDIICVSKKHKGKSLRAQVCADCQSHFSNENVYIYDSAAAVGADSKPGLETRTGDGKEPKREFKMAVNGINFHRVANNTNDKPRVLIWGAGLSRDHELVTKSNLAASVHIADVVDMQDTDNFIAVDEPNFTADVIACAEVIEHFTDVENDFKRMFDKLDENGIMLCSTNIHDKEMEVERLTYPFIKGHTSYYSGSGLMALARRNGFYLDFRNLEGSQAVLGPRKKLLIFYKNPEYAYVISEYFSRRWLFPSERSSNIY